MTFEEWWKNINLPSSIMVEEWKKVCIDAWYEGYDEGKKQGRDEEMERNNWRL